MAPMSPKDATEAVREIIAGPQAFERRRLQKIKDALDPDVSRPSVLLPVTAPKNMYDLAEKSRTNYLPLLLDVLSQSLVVEGYRPARASENARPWAIWQKNGFDARQVGIHRAALAYGVAYVTVLPGDTAPVMRGVSPMRMTALYQDPVEDEWPMLALRDDVTTVRLYDESAVYYFTRDNLASPLVFTESREHGAGVCPVVRYRERMLLEDDPLGVIEPLLPIQSRIDETVFGLLVAQFFSAFKQRWAVGWVPQSEAEALAASAGHLWTFQDANVKLGEFAETNLQGYIDSQRAGIVDMAAISQVPPHQLGGVAVANLSAEALAALQNGKDLKADEFKTSLGESHEQSLRLAARLDGDAEGAADLESQMRWKDVTARSLAQVADAFGKMAESLGIPKRALWEKIPGVTDQDLLRWEALADQVDPFAALTAELQRQATPAPVVTPNVGA